jgi:hypothetical protein
MKLSNHSVEVGKEALNEDKNFQDLLNACRKGDLERVERLLDLTSN